MRVVRSRELVAKGRPPATVARVALISRQALYRRPKRARWPERKFCRGASSGKKRMVIRDSRIRDCALAYAS